MSISSIEDKLLELKRIYTKVFHAKYAIIMDGAPLMNMD